MHLLMLGKQLLVALWELLERLLCVAQRLVQVRGLLSLLPRLDEPADGSVDHGVLCVVERV